MRTYIRKSIVLITIVLMATVSLVPATGSSPDVESRGPGPMADATPWTDPLDDLSRVYVPGSGLVGVEVTGGSAHLKTGSNNGWIASEIITCPPDFRYDLVVVEVDTPGDSQVLVSVLNATADPSEVGFANETVPNFKLLNATDIPVTSISASRYPAIRLQASLVASGTDRPTLLSWTLYYVGTGEWKDTFMGSGKMTEFENINFTGNTLEVDLTASASGGGAGVGDYDPYPPIIVAGYQQVRFLYPNAGNTDYQAEETLPAAYTMGLDIADLDNDGFLDVVVAEQSVDSTIYWGDSSGTYSTSRKDGLGASGREVETADFNGDGWTDIGLAGTGTGSIFLNDGAGSFSASPDQSITGTSYYAASGDFNGDGYDDMIFSYPNSNVHYGGPTGVSTTADVTLAGYYTKAGDLDLDGYDDVLTYVTGTGIKIYMGKASGIDAVADYSLVGATAAIYYPNFGDINGDGYIDITGSELDTGTYKISVFEGAADGWKSTRKHTAWTGSWARTYAADIDKDGADEVIIAKSSGGYAIEIYSSTASWTFSELTTKALTGYVYDVAVAIPKGAGGGPKAYRGTFTTIPITIPDALNLKWDVAYLDGIFPANTSAKITVLDGFSDTPITGYKELAAMDVDLSGIKPSDHLSIKLQVTIMTEFNTTTPVLDSLTVKWMDNRVWRDEFYGPAKVDRMLNIDVAGGTMQAGDIGGQGPQLIFPTLLGDANYTTSAMAYYDAGSADYLSRDPFNFRVKGTTDADIADVNGDGYMDLAFSVQQTDNVTFDTKSPLFMGGPMGIQDTPQHRWDTTGASGIVLRDIDGDGYVDAVFSQEKRAEHEYLVGSILYWGSEDGFADTPDLTFSTTGASDVEAVDVNGDGLLDLVFACFRDATSTSTDSMVFLQDGTEGFCSTVPDRLLPTKGARAVASGDLDGDGHLDLAFANGLAGGFAEIDSYIYWGKAGGDFETAPLIIPTMGAEDVLIANIDGTSGLDIVFANHWDNSQNLAVDSYIFLGSNSRAFGPTPDERLPTIGAAGVTAADIDGTGYADLVFANQRSSTSFQVPSYVYLGTASGWPPVPDVRIPTEGAYSVLAADFVGYGTGGYLSKPILIDHPERSTGTLDTFRYTANIGAAQGAELMIVDADTWEVLGSISMATGTHEWDLDGIFRVKEHPVVRVMLVASGMEAAGQFTVDQLWFNWTQRIEAPPTVLDMGMSATSVYRTESIDLWVNVTDDYDGPHELTLTVQQRLNGTTDDWVEDLATGFTYNDRTGSWETTVTPKVNVPPGLYDLRITAEDLDFQFAPWLEFPGALEVLNNVATTPVVRIAPDRAVTTSALIVEFDLRSSDVETAGITYNFTWFRDGVLVPGLTEDSVPTYLTSKGENWTVEVRAWDGDEFSLPASSWVMIFNTPPSPKDNIPDPDLDEDTVNSDWINLANAFQDNDGDPLTWSLGNTPVNITIDIDHDTGTVTITPKEHWFGEEDVTFVASDGELQTSQTVTVLVHSVNDIPWIATVDGSAPSTDPMEYTVKQGGKLVITYTTDDIEGDEVQADVSIPGVTLDEAAGTITFEPARHQGLPLLHHRGGERERPHGRAQDNATPVGRLVQGQPELHPPGHLRRPGHPVRPGTPVRLEFQHLGRTGKGLLHHRQDNGPGHPPHHPDRQRPGLLGDDGDNRHHQAHCRRGTRAGPRPRPHIPPHQLGAHRGHPGGRGGPGSRPVHRLRQEADGEVRGQAGRQGGRRGQEGGAGTDPRRHPGPGGQVGRRRGRGRDRRKGRRRRLGGRGRRLRGDRHGAHRQGPGHGGHRHRGGLPGREEAVHRRLRHRPAHGRGEGDHAPGEREAPVPERHRPPPVRHPVQGAGRHGLGRPGQLPRHLREEVGGGRQGGRPDRGPLVLLRPRGHGHLPQGAREEEGGAGPQGSQHRQGEAAGQAGGAIHLGRDLRGRLQGAQGEVRRLSPEHPRARGPAEQ